MPSIQHTLKIRHPAFNVFCAVAEGSERGMLASLCGWEPAGENKAGRRLSAILFGSKQAQMCARARAV